MTWQVVRARPLPAERDLAVAVLVELGSSGVQELGDEIVAHLPDSLTESQVTAALGDAGVNCAAEFGGYVPVDWVESWRHSVKPIQVDDIVITPPWLAHEQAGSAHAILIEPGMGFGTGDHESTRAALRLVRRHLKPGDRVADLGAGSGIQSIASVKLGARSVIAIEIDADALINAAQNITMNSVDDRIVVLHGDAGVLLPLAAPVELVIANIEFAPLRRLLPAIGESLSPGGTAILSGLLSEERQAFDPLLHGSAFRIVDEIHEGAWCAIAIRH